MKFQGCKFDPYDNRDWGFQATAIKIPRSVDNRKFVSSIKDQGAESSCVGFAVAKGVETVLGKGINNQFENMSERWAYEKAKAYDEWPGENYEGSSVRGGLKAINKEGICQEKFWPYRANKKGKPKPEAQADAAKHKIVSYTRVNGIQNIKSAIYENGIVVGAALVHGGWLKPAQNGIIPIKKNILGGHAFALVGYGGKGFWVANSWGMGWGKKGFGILLFNDAELHLVDAWTIKMASGDDQAPAPAVCPQCGRPL